MALLNIMNVRSALIDHILKTLEPHRFERTGDIFEARRFMVRPGHRVIINGQLFEEEPIKIPFSFHIELLGDGHVASGDGRIEPFELISFGIKVGEELRRAYVNVYYDSHLEFNKHLRTFFKL